MFFVDFLSLLSVFAFPMFADAFAIQLLLHVHVLLVALFSLSKFLYALRIMGDIDRVGFFDEFLGIII